MGTESSKKTKNASEKKPLTELQSKVFAFIKGYWDRFGRAPSYREIQKGFGFSAVGTVQDHVRGLIQRGYLENAVVRGKKRQTRTLVPVGYQWEGTLRIPIYGEIAAGAAREAEQLEFGSLVVSERMVQNPSFALKVVGNSMIDAGIFEGDMLVVQKETEIKNGDIVVALLDGETTVKRYEKRSDGVFLIPENRTMKPIAVKNSAFSIQGKVVGLQRTYKK